MINKASALKKVPNEYKAEVILTLEENSSNQQSFMNIKTSQQLSPSGSQSRLPSSSRTPERKKKRIFDKSFDDNVTDLQQSMFLIGDTSHSPINISQIKKKSDQLSPSYQIQHKHY